jgi:hypothetical protein
VNETDTLKLNILTNTSTILVIANKTQGDTIVLGSYKMVDYLTECLVSLSVLATEVLVICGVI